MDMFGMVAEALIMALIGCLSTKGVPVSLKRVLTIDTTSIAALTFAIQFISLPVLVASPEYWNLFFGRLVNDAIYNAFSGIIGDLVGSFIGSIWGNYGRARI
jgi:hypothetical protein